MQVSFFWKTSLLYTCYLFSVEFVQFLCPTLGSPMLFTDSTRFFQSLYLNRLLEYSFCVIFDAWTSIILRFFLEFRFIIIIIATVSEMPSNIFMPCNFCLLENLLHYNFFHLGSCSTKHDGIMFPNFPSHFVGFFLIPTWFILNILTRLRVSQLCLRLRVFVRYLLQ